MRISSLAGASLIAALVFAPLGAQRGGDTSQERWTVRGVERRAVVVAPAATASKPGTPLVLVFHGHGGTSAQAARSFAIHTHWPEALVIYPQGLPTPGRLTDPEGRRPGWQHAPGDQSDRDLAFVDALIEWATTKFSVDRARVYAAGHSNGGTMTYVIWAARSEAFDAVAVSGSVLRRDLLPRVRPKPALVVAGEKDRLVPFAAQKASVDAILRLNGAAAAGTPWSDGAVRHVSSAGTDVITYIYPGDHTLPAAAGKVMAAFFKERRREARER